LSLRSTKRQQNDVASTLGAKKELQFKKQQENGDVLFSQRHLGAGRWFAPSRGVGATAVALPVSLRWFDGSGDE